MSDIVQQPFVFFTSFLNFAKTGHYHWEVILSVIDAVYL